MSATWMLGSAIVALLCWLAAATLARVIALYRGAALRWIWIGAAVLSLGISLNWLLAGSTLRGRTPDSQPRAATDGMLPRVLPARATESAITHSNDASSWSRSLAPPSLPVRADRIALAAWLVASMTFFSVLFAAVLRLRLDQRTWTPNTIANTPVLVSERFGPAVVGVARSVIVVPSWVLALDEHAQRMIVRHEVEHGTARDPAVLMVASAVLVLMPWNVGLWMLWRGLRRAIEIDCDARVVRSGVESADYANVLLRAWRRSRGGWMPSTAFAEKASGLGGRVEHLLRPEPRGRIVKSIFGAVLAMPMIVVACTMRAPRTQSSLGDAYPLTIIDGLKRPELPPQFRFVGPVSAETISTPRFEIHYSGRTALNPEAASLYPPSEQIAEVQEIPAPTAEAQFGPEAKFGAHLIYTKRYLEGGGRVIRPDAAATFIRRADPGTALERMLGIVYARMFRGIHLDSQGESRARESIRREMAGQSTLRGPVLAIWPKRIALANDRSAELRALVSGADLATLEENLKEYTYHEITPEEVERSQYASLLQGVTLGADDQERARARIRTFVRDELAAYERSPDSGAELVQLRSALEDDLRSLVHSHPDRELYDRRVALMRAHR